MFVYWSIFAIPAVFSLFESYSRPGFRFHPIVIFLVILFFIMAFRESGGDYSTYLSMYDTFAEYSLAEWMAVTEPLYGALNWFANALDLGIYGVNAVCALIFLLGLFTLAMDEPKPALFVVAAIPYLIIVVGIGYTRQATAIGFFMIGMHYLRRRRPIIFTGFMLLAVGFHTSSALLMPLSYFGFSERLGAYKKYVGFTFAAISLYVLFNNNADRFDTLQNVYAANDHYQSAGALQRALLNALGAGVLFMFRKSWQRLFPDYSMFFFFALLTLLFVPLSIYYSTIADRMGLYLIPFQITVLARLPLLQGKASRLHISSLAVIIFYAVVLFVWLHLGQFAQTLWLPYRSLILPDLG
jgi:EpsG family